MKKCLKCGAEFADTHCPNCGTRAALDAGREEERPTIADILAEALQEVIDEDKNAGRIVGKRVRAIAAYKALTASEVGKEEVKETNPSSNSNSKELTEWDKGFIQGFAAACAITVRNYGESIIAEETYRCNFQTVKQLRNAGVDEMDIEILEPIIKEILRKKP
jgi:hypothetical protein